MQTSYPIRAVAKITGLSLDTLRAWERRYQAVVPERSNRGRQYGPEHIERLLLLSQLVQKGHAIGGIAPLADQELRNLLREQPSRQASAPESSPEICTPILSAIEIFDSARAGDELSRLAAVLSPRDLVYQVAVPLMREVGARYHDGTFAIAQEHMLSQLLRNLLGSMMRLFRPAKGAMKMLLATPSGEPHEFGILVSAMLASAAGMESVCLGPDLPALEIANAARRVSAQVILLGITVLTETTLKEVREVAAVMPEDGELWVGGPASAELDLANLGRKVVFLRDFPALESEFRRWSDSP